MLQDGVQQRFASPPPKQSQRSPYIIPVSASSPASSTAAAPCARHARGSWMRRWPPRSRRRRRCAASCCARKRGSAAAAAAPAAAAHAHTAAAVAYSCAVLARQRPASQRASWPHDLAAHAATEVYRPPSRCLWFPKAKKSPTSDQVSGREGSKERRATVTLRLASGSYRSPFDLKIFT